MKIRRCPLFILLYLEILRLLHERWQCCITQLERAKGPEQAQHSSLDDLQIGKLLTETIVFINQKVEKMNKINQKMSKNVVFARTCSIHNSIFISAWISRASYIDAELQASSHNRHHYDKCNDRCLQTTIDPTSAIAGNIMSAIAAEWDRLLRWPLWPLLLCEVGRRPSTEWCCQPKVFFCSKIVLSLHRIRNDLSIRLMTRFYDLNRVGNFTFRQYRYSGSPWQCFQQWLP